jgi:hypothetical protein
MTKRMILSHALLPKSALGNGGDGLFQIDVGCRVCDTECRILGLMAGCYRISICCRLLPADSPEIASLLLSSLGS